MHYQRRHYILILLISLSGSFSLFGQISGQVKNADSGAIIADVNVFVAGQELGTSTNKSGYFTFSRVDFPAEVHFSALGFEHKIITLQKPETELLVWLEPTFLDLEEIVVVPDRIINPITKSSPIARSSVSIEELSNKSVTSAVELLRAETGVFVQQTSVGQGSLYIRGRAGRDVLYLFNGFRMNPSFVRSGQNQYFGAIDPFLINKLDVYRGPVSVYYGSDALSGGVNISPIIKDFSAKNKWSGEASAFLNIDGNGEKSLHGKLAYQSPTVSLFLGGTYRDFEYYNMSSRSNEELWFPYDETLSNADYQFNSVQFSSMIKTGENSTLSFISYKGQIPEAPRLDRQTLGFSIEEPMDGLRPRFGYYSNTSPLVFWGNTAEYRISTSNKIIENLGLKAAYFKLNDFRKEQDYAVNNAPAFAINNAERDYSFLVSDTTIFDRSSSNQLQASLDIGTSISRTMYLKWGADISYDRVESVQFSNYGQTMLPRFPDGSEYTLSGFFGQLDYAPNKKFSLEYGIRYSHIFASIPFEGIDTKRRYNPYSDNFGQLTHALGLSYKLRPNLALLSNISTGFRAPNVADLSEIGIRRSDQFQTPNTDLRPETTRNLDIGILFEHKQYYLEAYAYWLHYFDKISRVQTGNLVNGYGEVVLADSPLQSWDAFNEVKNANVNSMDLLGFEFNGAFTNNEYIKTGFTFTYSWGNLKNLDGSVEPVDRIPPTNGIFYVDFTPSENISFRPQARYAFAQRRISPDEVDDIRVSQYGTDGFVNLQLLVNMQPKENVGLKFVADNIMDAAYREHASALDGMGRNFTISLSYTF